MSDELPLDEKALNTMEFESNLAFAKTNLRDELRALIAQARAALSLRTERDDWKAAADRAENKGYTYMSERDAARATVRSHQSEVDSLRTALSEAREKLAKAETGWREATYDAMRLRECAGADQAEAAKYLGLRDKENALRKQAESALSEARAALEEAKKYEDELLAVLGGAVCPSCLGGQHLKCQDDADVGQICHCPHFSHGDSAVLMSPQDEVLTLTALREANAVRQKEWDRGDVITLEYRGNELAGEVGEACNVVKKLARERLGIRGSRATTQQLADELADVVICVDLVAMQAGIDLGAAVVSKFNATSEKNSLQTRLLTSHRTAGGR